MAVELKSTAFQLSAVNGEEYSEAAVYKRLYHESVERCSILQEQVERSKGLMTKLKKIEELKEVALTLIAENKAQIDSRLQVLSREKQQWKEKLHQSATTCDRLMQECSELRQFQNYTHPRMCGKLLAESALSRAVARVQQDTKDKENAKVIRKMFKYISSLQRENKELRESLEFSVAERLTLSESNTELEAEIATYQKYLAEKQRALVEKQAVIDEMRKPSAVKHSTDLCSCSGQLKGEHKMMFIDRGHTKHSDLLRENIVLKQKLVEAEQEFELVKKEAMDEFERITCYIKNYKSKSMEKVRILKENLSKADGEISELDQLVDKTREVMHSEIEVVKRSPLLLELIRDLDGTEAPETY